MGILFKIISSRPAELDEGEYSFAYAGRSCSFSLGYKGPSARVDGSGKGTYHGKGRKELLCEKFVLLVSSLMDD